MELHDNTHDVASLSDDESQSNTIAPLGEDKGAHTLSTTDQSKTLCSTSGNISSAESPIITMDDDDQSNCIPDLSSSALHTSKSIDKTSDDKKKSIASDESFVSELGELRLADEE